LSFSINSRAFSGSPPATGFLIALTVMVFLLSC
jgi:hypothetical protein